MQCICWMGVTQSLPRQSQTEFGEKLLIKLVCIEACWGSSGNQGENMGSGKLGGPLHQRKEFRMYSVVTGQPLRVWVQRVDTDKAGSGRLFWRLC